MSDLYAPGPHDLAYKPERITSAAWERMNWWDRYEVARLESPAWRAESDRRYAEYLREGEED